MRLFYFFPTVLGIEGILDAEGVCGHRSSALTSAASS